MTFIVNFMPKMRTPTRSLKNSVAVLAYDGVCTFEIGIAIEVFGLSRMGSDWYRLVVCADRPGQPVSANGGSKLSPVRGWSSWIPRALSSCRVGKISMPPPLTRCSNHCVAHMRMGRGWPRSARRSLFSRPRACSTGTVLPFTGLTPRPSRACTPGSMLTRRRSTWMKAIC